MLVAISRKGKGEGEKIFSWAGPKVLCPARLPGFIPRARGRASPRVCSGKVHVGTRAGRGGAGRVQGRSLGGQRGWEGSGTGGLEGGQKMGNLIPTQVRYF